VKTRFFRVHKKQVYRIFRKYTQQSIGMRFDANIVIKAYF